MTCFTIIHRRKKLKQIWQKWYVLLKRDDEVHRAYYTTLMKVWSFIIKLFFKKNLLWLHSPQDLNECYPTFKTTPNVKLDFLMNLKHLTELFHFSLRIHVCVCARASTTLPMYLLPDWLYHYPFKILAWPPHFSG